MVGGHLASSRPTRSAHYRNGELPPEPKKTKWDACNLPASPWVGVPIQFIEILIMITPSAFLPDLLVNHFNGSYPLSAISTGTADSLGGLLAFVMSPTFGKWSDIYGRKPVILLLSILSFLPTLCLCFYPWLNLWAYLSVRGFTKISAFGILFSCVADVAPTEKRARLYSQTTGLGMTAIVVGPFFSLILNAHWAFRVSGFFALFVIFYLKFLMPETLWIGLKRMVAEEEAQKQAATATITIKDGETEPTAPSLNEGLTTSLLSHPNPSGTRITSVNSSDAEPSSSSSHPPLSPSRSDLLASTGPLLPIEVPEAIIAPPPILLEPAAHEEDTTKPPSLNPCTALRAAFFSPLHRNLALVILFSQIAQNGVVSGAQLYLKYEFHFTKNDNSILLLYMGSWSVAIMVILMPLLLRKKDEKFVLIFALFMDLVHQMTYIVLPNKHYFYFISFFQGFGFMSLPAANGLLSRCVADSEQGTVLAMSAGIRSLTQGLAPIFFNGLFSYFTWHRAFAHFPQAPFCLTSTCIVIALIIAFRLPKSKQAMEREAMKKQQEEEKSTEGGVEEESITNGLSALPERSVDRKHSVQA